MTQITTDKFNAIVDQVTDIGCKQHADRLIEHATLNLADLENSIKKILPPTGDKAKSGIVISAGPSVHKRKTIKRLIDAGYKGTIIAVDGAYIACLKAGLIPDYVVTLDPHLTRIVRWFGDNEFEEHTKNDDYFARQDLDIEFRKNSIEQNKQHIELVNKYGHLTKAIVATSAPRNVVKRLKEAKFDIYWWNPLVDDPNNAKGLTRQIYNINKIPCMNTGGTVGTAAWVFAVTYLKLPAVALAGMDLGYYHDLPREQTQLYYELLNHLNNNKDDLEQYFVNFEFPLTKEKFYTDPTYYWYRRNFFDLLLRAPHAKTINCTEGGTLYGDGVQCMYLEDFITRFK